MICFLFWTMRKGIKMSDLQMEDLRENIQNELADMTVNDFTNLIQILFQERCV